MCDQCHTPNDTPPSPRKSLFSRRAFLAFLAGASGGAAISQWSCQPKKSPGRKPLAATASAPSETTGPATTSPASAPATAAATSAATAASAPTPDLGSALFPDARGQPIATAADCPVLVIPRRDWTAHPPNFNELQLMNGISRLTVHHTGWNLDTDAWKTTADDLENIRSFHAGTKTTDRQWADIAYHFVIDRAGRVWQARPLAYQGAHAKDHNPHNLGICLLGNFDAQMPAAAQLWALSAFIPFVRNLYGIELAHVYTHRELRDTACPGMHLQSFMDRARLKWERES